MSRPNLISLRKLQRWQKKKDLYDMAIFRQPERMFHQVIGDALDRMESDDNSLRTMRQFDVTQDYKQTDVSTTGLRKI